MKPVVTLLAFVAACFLFYSCDNPCEDFQPSYSINASSETVLKGESITFSAEGNGIAECGLQYEWTFEGGSPAFSTESEVSVTFSELGSHAVKLKVKNTVNGFSSTDIKETIVICDGVYCSPSFSVKVTKGVVYGVDQQSHLMNVYEPENDERTERPVILFFGGGGGSSGSNLDYLDEFSRTLASYGFIVAAARYRTNQNYETFLITGQQDTKACARYFRKEAAQWKVDTDWIINGGYATGAIIALFHTYITEDELPAEFLDKVNALGGWEGQQGNEEFSSEVKGIVGLAGELYATTSWIDESEPFYYAVHGNSDQEITCNTFKTPDNTTTYGSCALIERAKAVGIPAELFVISGGSHSSPRTDVEKYIFSLTSFLRIQMGLPE